MTAEFIFEVVCELATHPRNKFQNDVPTQFHHLSSGNGGVPVESLGGYTGVCSALMLSPTVCTYSSVMNVYPLQSSVVLNNLTFFLQTWYLQYALIYINLYITLFLTVHIYSIRYTPMSSDNNFWWSKSIVALP